MGNILSKIETRLPLILIFYFAQAINTTTSPKLKSSSKWSIFLQIFKVIYRFDRKFFEDYKSDGLGIKKKHGFPQIRWKFSPLDFAGKRNIVADLYYRPQLILCHSKHWFDRNLHKNLLPFVVNAFNTLIEILIHSMVLELALNYKE